MLNDSKRHTKHGQTLQGKHRKTPCQNCHWNLINLLPITFFILFKSFICHYSMIGSHGGPECQTCVHSDVKGFRFTELGLDIGCDFGNKMEGRRCIKSLGNERMLWCSDAQNSTYSICSFTPIPQSRNMNKHLNISMSLWISRISFRGDGTGNCPGCHMMSRYVDVQPDNHQRPRKHQTYPWRIHGAAIHGNMDPINIPPLC